MSEKVDPQAQEEFAHDASKGANEASSDVSAGAHNAQDAFAKAPMTLKLWGLTFTGVIASCLEQPNFALAFDYEAQGGNIVNLIGMIVGIFNVGGMFGPIGTCFIQDRWGRKAGFAFGFLSVTGLGFYYDAESLLNWRIPLIIHWIPESPRWLALQGRTAESLAVLTSIHSHPLDLDHNVARAESYQITAQAEFDKAQESSWKSIFFGKYKKRSAVIILLWTGNMFTGVEIPLNYGPTLYAALGYSTPVALGIGLALLVLAVVVSAVAAELCDRAGRRVWIIAAFGGCGATMALISGLFAHFDPLSTNQAVGQTLIFAFLFFEACYALGEPALYTMSAEMFPSHVRVKGVAVGLFTLNAHAVWIEFLLPTALVTIGYGYYLIFAVLTVFTVTGIYVWVPEFRNVPLEEISRCFGEDEDVQVRASDIVFDAHGEIKRIPALA
ncbi:hypothetical protein RQP46_001159 [Phenoliferia psychrophenolica]